MELEIIYLSPHDLTPYENNARKHAPEDVGAIKKSIERFGLQRCIKRASPFLVTL